MKIFNIIKINDKIEPYIIDNDLGCFSKCNTFKNVLKDVCQNIYNQSKCVEECFILSFNCKNDIGLLVKEIISSESEDFNTQIKKLLEQNESFTDKVIKNESGITIEDIVNFTNNSFKKEETKMIDKRKISIYQNENQYYIFKSTLNDIEENSAIFNTYIKTIQHCISFIKKFENAVFDYTLEIDIVCKDTNGLKIIKNIKSTYFMHFVIQLNEMIFEVIEYKKPIYKPFNSRTSIGDKTDMVFGTNKLSDELLICASLPKDNLQEFYICVRNNSQAEELISKVLKEAVINYFDKKDSIFNFEIFINNTINQNVDSIALLYSKDNVVGFDIFIEKLHQLNYTINLLFQNYSFNHLEYQKIVNVIDNLKKTNKENLDTYTMNTLKNNFKELTTLTIY